MRGRKYRGTPGAGGKDKWGPGAQWDKVQPFEVGRFGDQNLERDLELARRPNAPNQTAFFDLFHGQHPHTRSDNNTYARVRHTAVGVADPVAFSGTRLRTRVEVHEYNYQKSSGLTGDEIKAMCQCTIYFYDHAVYGFNTRVAERALLRAALIIPELAEHPVDWRKVDGGQFTDLIGRKITVNGEKAVVAYYFPEQGSFVAKPDGAKRFMFADKLEITNDGGETWKDDLLAPYAKVSWFRETAEKPRRGKGK